MEMQSGKPMDMDMGGMEKGNMDMGGDMDMMMQMYFTAGTKVTILFASWKTTDGWSLFGSVISIILMGFLYEAVKYFREYLICKHQAGSGKCENQNLLSPSNASAAVPSSSNRGDTVNQRDSNSPCSICKTYLFNRYHLLQTFLHFIQIGLGYLLMLIAMTYNFGVSLGF